MQMIMDFGDRGTTLNPAPLIKQFDVWFPDDARQRVLWPSEVTLSGEFFESLQRHALPLDTRAIRALQHSARALDIYTWLTHRLPRVTKTTKVSWAALHAQFGPDVSDNRTFRRQFTKAMRQALAVYPTAKVDSVEGGIELRKSPPAIQRIGGK
jgi:hypothetical protein